MDCAVAGEHLVSYHLGDVAEEHRDAVEEHLVACPSCLRTYLAMKRASDRDALDRPRPEVKARLRSEVARAFPANDRGERADGPRNGKAVGVLARRIPLYQGVALAALAAAVALAAPNVMRRVSRAEAAGTPSIDTSRTRAESLRIY